MEWAIGVTTVPQRITTTLPRTLASLSAAGFDDIRLFVDGYDDLGYPCFGLLRSIRGDRIGAFGNWWLAAWELYIRNPKADRYAIFQDDVLLFRNVRQYLELLPYPDHGYCNLALYPQNQQWCVEPGWNRVGGHRGWGAQGLVFSHEAMRALLRTDDNILLKPGSGQGTRNLDGAVADSMHNSGWDEYVHFPSLLTHIGDVSELGNRRQPEFAGFPGEDFDAMSLLGDPRGR